MDGGREGVESGCVVVGFVWFGGCDCGCGGCGCGCGCGCGGRVVECVCVWEGEAYWGAEEGPEVGETERTSSLGVKASIKARWGAMEASTATR